jgi:hypothetical protein
MKIAIKKPGQRAQALPSEASTARFSEGARIPVLNVETREHLYLRERVWPAFEALRYGPFQEATE